MPKSKPPYPPELRAEAIRLARTSGRPRAAIARDLGLTPETLRIWLKQGDLDAGRRSDGITTEERAELRRLRREVRVLREERAILKKPWLLRAGDQLDLVRGDEFVEREKVHHARSKRSRSRSTLARPNIGRLSPLILCTKPSLRPLL